MENEVILKRAIFGGFDRKQVMEYIAYLHGKSNTVKDELAELSDLKSMVAELEAEITEKDNMIDRLHSAVSEAENSTRLNRASATLIKESVAYADCYVASAKVLARDISEKTQVYVDDAKIKIDDIMDSIGDISDSILELYTSVDGLKSEYENFTNIYPQGEFEIPSEIFESVASATAEKIVEAPVSDDTDTGSFPSEEDMTEFLRRMEAKYKGMLINS